MAIFDVLALQNLPCEQRFFQEGYEKVLRATVYFFD